MPIRLLILLAVTAAHADEPCPLKSQSARLAQTTLDLQAVSRNVSSTKAGVGLHGIDFLAPLSYARDFQVIDHVNPNAPKGGELRMAMSQPANTLVPVDWGGMAQHRIASPIFGAVFEQLMTRVPGSVTAQYGLVAESVDYPQDLSSVTFHIRREARFNNSAHSPVTAEDIKFSYETLLQSDPKWYAKGVYRNVEDVEVVDNNTIRFKLNAKSVIDAQSAITSLGEVYVLSKAYYTLHPISGSGSSALPVGTGPYRVTKFEADKSIDLQRDREYWGRNLPITQGQYNFDRLHEEKYLDDTVARTALWAGELNCRIESNDSYWNAKLRNLPKESPVHTTEFLNLMPSSFDGLALNSAKPYLDDPSVRRALSSLFNFDYINKFYFSGGLSRSTSFFQGTPYAHDSNMSASETALLEPFRSTLPPEVFASNPSPHGALPGSREVIRQAYADLTKAGWRYDKAKLRFVDQKGEPIFLRVLYKDKEDEKILLNYKDTLKKLGIELDLNLADPARRQTEINKGQYDLTFHRFYISHAPSYERLKDHFASEAVGSMDMDNEAAVKSPVVDALIERLNNSGTDEERTAAARALDRVLLAESYLIPFGTRTAQKVACRRDVHYPEKAAPGEAIGLAQVGWHQPTEAVQ